MMITLFYDKIDDGAEVEYAKIVAVKLIIFKLILILLN